MSRPPTRSIVLMGFLEYEMQLHLPQEPNNYQLLAVAEHSPSIHHPLSFILSPLHPLEVLFFLFPCLSELFSLVLSLGGALFETLLAQ